MFEDCVVTNRKSKCDHDGDSALDMVLNCNTIDSKACTSANCH